MRQFFLLAATVMTLSECRPSHYHNQKLFHPLSVHLPTIKNGANADHACNRNRNGTCRRETRSSTLTKSAFLVTNIPRGGQWRDDDRDEDDDPYQSQPYRNNNNNDDDYYADRRDDGRYNGDYDDRGGYYDDRRPSERNSGGMGSTLSSTFASMPDLVTKGNRKIGLGFLALGSVFTLLGVSLFFNKTLMRMGNLLFIGGVPLTIGPGRTAGYFFQPKKARATGCLVLGILLVFVGWPVLGIILEAFGLLNLFGNMFPIFLLMLKQMPIIGPLLKRPPFNNGGGGGGSGGGGFGRGRRDDRDDSYEDRPYYDDDDGRGDTNESYY